MKTAETSNHICLRTTEVRQKQTERPVAGPVEAVVMAPAAAAAAGEERCTYEWMSC